MRKTVDTWEMVVIHRMFRREFGLLPAWCGRADATSRDALAVMLDDVSVALAEHLDDEENEILPLVSVHITQAEWDALGERGKQGIPKGSKGFVALGMILEDATPGERPRFLGLLPPPVRLLYRLIGEGVYRRAKTRLHGAV